MINAIGLIIALCITLISGYLSSVGLTSIYSLPSSYYVILAIAASFEIAKIYFTIWLHAKWEEVNILMKTYSIAIIVVLIMMNAISSFGFLSKSSIDEILHATSGGIEQVQIIDSKVILENNYVDDFNKQINQIDDAINKLSQTGKAVTSLNAANQQKQKRDNLVKQRDEHVKNIQSFNEQRIKADTDVKRLESEVGPLKYISQMVYGNTDNAQLEKAVRILTSLIVLIFDPLAVMLLLSTNIGVKKRKPLTKEDESNILKIGDNIFEK